MKKCFVFWFTGLSGAGKSTVAQQVQAQLQNQNIATLILDGDDVRQRLHQYLGFSEKDVKHNNALIAELCIKEGNDYQVILVPIISPFASSRAKAKEQIGEGFFEIYFNAGIDVVMKRDPKGLYAKASAGEIPNLIGFSPNAIYEPPLNPDCIVNTIDRGVTQSVSELLDFILEKIKSA